MHIFNSASKIAMLTALLFIALFTGLGIEVTEPMKTISLMIISFYFGNKTNPRNDGI